MLRTFLIENENKLRAIVTELELPKTADWRIVRELLSLADPIRQVEAAHVAVSSSFVADQTVSSFIDQGGGLKLPALPETELERKIARADLFILLTVAAVGFLFLRK